MKGRRLGAKGATAVFGVVCVLLLAPSSAGAADFVVNSLNDAAADGCTTAPGGCTLRDAITDANANGQPDDITFSVTGSILLSSSLPTITTAMTITGPGPDASALAVRGNTMSSSQTILAVNVGAGVTARIERIEIADSRATSFAGGGVVKDGAGTLVIDSVRLFDNDASQGGALFLGTGFTSIRNSTLESNRSETGGGAIVASKLFSTPATAELINSTLAGNSAKQFGGAIDVANGASVSLLSSTIVGNTANSDNNVSGNGGGIFNNASTVNIANTILAGNVVGAGGGSDGQCLGAFASSGHNLRSAADTGCTGFTATGDIVDASPLLGELGSNGGPTQTIALLTGSPAIDAGDPSAPGGAFPACPATDQRGLPRGGGAGTCDIGAFEVQPPPPPEEQPAPGEPVPSKAARTAALDASKSKVKKGKKVTLSGRIDAPQNAACEAGQAVELRRGKGADLNTFKQVQSDSTGTFEAKVKVKKTLTYQARVPETAACAPTTSNAEKVRAKKKKSG